MKAPLNTEKWTLMAGGQPRIATKYQSEEPRLSESGVPIFLVDVVIAGAEERPSTWRVQVVGKPDGIDTGTIVRLVDSELVVTQTRSGIFAHIDAAKIVPVNPAKPATSAAV